jgi:hypothetical protein
VKRCGAVWRLRHPESVPSIAEIAWAAGFFEGEGCITMSNERPAMRVNGTDPETVKFFGAVVGVGKVYGPYQHKPDRHGCVRKPFWVWVAYGPSAYRAIGLLAPWLSKRRLARIRQVYAGFQPPPYSQGGRRLRRHALAL